MAGGVIGVAEERSARNPDVEATVRQLVDGIATRVFLSPRNHTAITADIYRGVVAGTTRYAPFARYIGDVTPGHVIEEPDVFRTIRPIALISNRDALADVPLSMRLVSKWGELTDDRSTGHLIRSIYTNPSLKSAMARRSPNDYSLLLRMRATVGTMNDKDRTTVTPILVIPGVSPVAEQALAAWEADHTYRE